MRQDRSIVRGQQWNSRSSQRSRSARLSGHDQMNVAEFIDNPDDRHDDSGFFGTWEDEVDRRGEELYRIAAFLREMSRLAIDLRSAVIEARTTGMEKAK